MSENVVEVENLTVRYGKLTAVDNNSFVIPRGEVFGFIGPNGAGKSSTIKVLATLMAPTIGTARVCGVDVTRRPDEVRRKIGYLPDAMGVYDDLTVNEYLNFFAAAYGLRGKKRSGVVRDVLALTDLTRKEWSLVDGLSRGMKQRLGLARTLLHDPELLLLDEPASGLDPRARIEMRELLKELQSMGKTILISSHILHELSQLCTCVGIIEQGDLKACGPLDDIFRQLHLGRIVHVAVADETPDTQTRLACLPGVERVDEEVDRWALHLAADLKVEDCHQAMVEAGFKIRLFQPGALDLETAFMKLTTGAVA